MTTPSESYRRNETPSSRQNSVLLAGVGILSATLAIGVYQYSKAPDASMYKPAARSETIVVDSVVPSSTLAKDSLYFRR